MSQRIFVFAFMLLVSPIVRASCGSSSCPLDTNALNLPQKGGFSLDLSFQYIDQDQPRIGTHGAQVGEIHGPHHDEVRTLNRVTTAFLTYAPTDRLHLSLTLPYVSREHNHLASNHAHSREPAVEHNVIPEAWDLNGFGDVTLQARASVHPHWWLIGGIKLPTGDHDMKNDDGEIGELPIQPGTGTTDGIAGVSWQGGVVRQTRTSGAMGSFALAPLFASATYQFRTGDAGGYRLGNEVQLNAGGAYPLLANVDVLLQLNSRFRGKDRVEDEPEEEAFTGGTFVYASPGVRLSFRDAFAVYAIVQLPLYQDVNGIQLTSDRNYVLGIQKRFR